MRIRKNGKFSPVMFLQSTLGPHQAVPKTICQLNQSPWDVISFSKEISSPSFHQFEEGDNCFGGKESFSKSIGVVERERSPNKKGFNNNEEKKIENELKIKKGEISVLHFDKTKGKGLDCIHESNEARSICDHHLNIIKPHKKSSGSGCLGVTDHSIKKPVTRALKGQTRSINKGRYPSSNANQFYYYSGFGPWQAKRRSERGESDGKETANDHSIPITVNGTAQSTTPPSPVPIIYIDDDSEEEDSD